MSNTIRNYRINIGAKSLGTFKEMLDRFKESDGIDRYRSNLEEDWYTKIFGLKTVFTTKICIYEDELLMLKLALGDDFESSISSRKYNAYLRARHQKARSNDAFLGGYSITYPTTVRVIMSNMQRSSGKSALKCSQK